MSIRTLLAMGTAKLAACATGLVLAVAPITVALAQTSKPEAHKEDEQKQDRFNQFKRALEQQRAHIEQLESEIDQQIAHTKELEAAAEEVEVAHASEMSQLMAEIKEASMRRINIHGFFDFTFYKYFIEKYSAFHLSIHDTSSFTITNLNLYFNSDITNSLKFLTEIRFSYLPHGYEESIEVENLPDSEYVMVNTEVMDPYSSEIFDQGGITIERVHLTYQPRDYFYIRAGRYITPYGIWNVDHGSPVVLPARLPYIQLQQVMPKAQTGLMIGGRAFPTDSIFLDYALTVSNGRGPADTLFDTDEHKALGLRLKGTWQHRDAQITLGGYGYLGTNTDINKTITVGGDPLLDPEGKVPEDRLIFVQVKTKSKYNEYVTSADFQLDWAGIRLQAEYAWNFINYSKPSNIDERDILAQGGVPQDTEWYTPSFSGYDVYGLIAYTLPLQRLIGSFRITPYYLYEHSELSDTLLHETCDLHIAGLHMTPWPAVVLKLEWSLIIPEKNDFWGSRLMGLAAQMAVSF